ncbi:hypothetical protein [Bradyrhizobium sp. BR 10261]|uniref:hypothetical protein n=1 Tax=Bradyrhizobium sp. BR 10261 TaxID=2749992 RepID=UPI001E313BB2|nr:hypothetical protein [Bradyrhizobium sp. BR 10261]
MPITAAYQARSLTLKQVTERTGMALSTLSKAAKGVCLCTSEAPDLYDQIRQIASRDVASSGDGELPP